MSVGTKNLTPKQRHALDVLFGAPMPLDGTALARKLDTSPEGAHQTMASLVRRGLVRKIKRHGLTQYVGLS